MKAWAIFQQSRSRTFQSEKDSEKMKTARENKEEQNTKKSPDSLLNQGSQVKMAASYSPALHCSTIGAGGLNFSVRNGKRWDPAAITTWNISHWTLTIEHWPLNWHNPTKATSTYKVGISTQRLKRKLLPSNLSQLKECAWCSMLNGQWSMLNDQWSMINGQWTPVNEHRRKPSGN